MAHAKAYDYIQVGLSLIQQTRLKNRIAHCRTYLFTFFRYSDRSLRTSLDLADDGIRFEVPCSGTMDYFCLFGGGSSFQTGGSGIAQQFSGTITGKAYAVSGGANISIPTGGLPGDVAGSSVESATYSWVS